MDLQPLSVNPAIPHYRTMAGPRGTPQAAQHLHKSKYGICWTAVWGTQIPDGVERPVGIRMSIDQQKPPTSAFLICSTVGFSSTHDVMVSTPFSPNPLT
jgi:hypothetical protein